MAGPPLVIVPAFNEQDALPATLDELLRVVEPQDVLVVDDGSADHTTEVARKVGVGVVRLPFNLGVGSALHTGFRYALEHGYECAVQLDADGQHDPEDLAILLGALHDGADMVIGSRFMGHGDYEVSRTRGSAMRMLTTVVRMTTGQRFTDTSSGFRAFGPRALERFARSYPTEYLSDTVEAIVIACRAGLRVVEVPVAMRVRTEGQPSNRNFRLAYHYTRLLVVLAAGAGKKEDLP